jgi:short subunit dehydrogenase-like uncharacterized protein
MVKDREFDIVVFGASGFTGELVAQYLASQPSSARAPEGALRPPRMVDPKGRRLDSDLP